MVRQPALADTLLMLSRDGLNSFCRGAGAQRLPEGFRAMSVPVTAADLTGHRAVVETTLSARFSGISLTTAGPNSQGYTALHSLGALLGGTDAHRDTYLADPRFASFDVEGMRTAAARTGPPMSVPQAGWRATLAPR